MSWVFLTDTEAWKLKKPVRYDYLDRETGDRPPERLVAFYKSFHACLRDKLAVWHLKDHGPSDWEKWTGGQNAIYS